MSRALMVRFNGIDYSLELEKVDRARLYGYVDTEVLDEEGQKCEMATLTGDGHTLVGRGGTALAQVSPGGFWREKKSLLPVDPRGQAIQPVRSTFEAPVELDKRATLEDYLAHNIHLVYRLSSEQDVSPLIEELRAGSLFTFPFSYRGGLEASVGFLLLGSDGNLFLVSGSPASFQFVGLGQSAAVVEDAPAEEDEEELDFSMV
jgi:hypothetical protein